MADQDGDVFPRVAVTHQLHLRAAQCLRGIHSRRQPPMHCAKQLRGVAVRDRRQRPDHRAGPGREKSLAQAQCAIGRGARRPQRLARGEDDGRRVLEMPRRDRLPRHALAAGEEEREVARAALPFRMSGDVDDACVARRAGESGKRGVFQCDGLGVDAGGLGRCLGERAKNQLGDECPRANPERVSVLHLVGGARWMGS